MGMYTHVHTHIHIHTYIHPYIHTSIHTYIHPSIHPYHRYLRRSGRANQLVLDWGFRNSSSRRKRDAGWAEAQRPRRQEACRVWTLWHTPPIGINIGNTKQTQYMHYMPTIYMAMHESYVVFMCLWNVHEDFALKLMDTKKNTIACACSWYCNYRSAALDASDDFVVDLSTTEWQRARYARREMYINIRSLCGRCVCKSVPTFCAYVYRVLIAVFVAYAVKIVHTVLRHLISWFYGCSFCVPTYCSINFTATLSNDANMTIAYTYPNADQVSVRIESRR